MAWGAIASIGLSMGSSIFNEVENQKMAKAGIKSSYAQIELLEKSKKALEELYSQRAGYITDRFGNSVKSLRSSAKNELYDSRSAYDVATSRSNLAFSGTAQTAYNERKDRVGTEYYNSYDQLELSRKESMSDLEMSKATKLGDIDKAIAELQGQIDVFSEQKKIFGIDSNSTFGKIGSDLLIPVGWGSNSFKQKGWNAGVPYSNSAGL